MRALNPSKRKLARLATVLPACAWLFAALLLFTPERVLPPLRGASLSLSGALPTVVERDAGELLLDRDVVDIRADVDTNLRSLLVRHGLTSIHHYRQAREQLGVARVSVRNENVRVTRGTTLRIRLTPVNTDLDSLNDTD